MNNRDVAIDIYNRLNRWSHGDLTDFAVGIIEDELDMAFPEDAKNSVQMKDYEKIGNCNDTHCKALHKHFVSASFLPECTRVEVIDQSGRAYVNWNAKNKVQTVMQDDNKTLKIFIT